LNGDSSSDFTWVTFLIADDFKAVDFKKEETSGHVPIHGPFQIVTVGGDIVKMKIFTGNGDAAVLEGELNDWLEKNPYITVKDIKQSYVSSGEQLFALMSLWYEK